MYFRHPHFICYKKGGAKCFAITGENRYYYSILKKGKCVMAHPSDMAVALMALNARAVIAGRDQINEVPLEDFFLEGNHLTETVLKPDELLREVWVPKQKHKTLYAFLKHRIRNACDFALVSVAVAVEILDGFCSNLRMVLGGVAPFPYPVPKVGEIMSEKRLNDELASQISELCVEQARPLRMNRYKKDLTKSLVKQALEAIQQKVES